MAPPYTGRVPHNTHNSSRTQISEIRSVDLVVEGEVQVRYDVPKTVLETRVSLLYSHQTLLPDDSLKLLAFYNHKANSIGFFARRKVASNKCLTSIFSQTIMKKGCY